MALVAGFALLFAAIKLIGSADGDGFYSVLSHNAMVAIFAPSFLLPLLSICIGLRCYWHEVGGQNLHLHDITSAFGRAARLQDLAAGHGEGCNFEDEDRFSHGRRHLHQAVMYGFLLCFASTSVATVMHYGFNMPAPYPLFSLPKLFGLSGGLLLTFGCVGMVVLKLKSDRHLGDFQAWSGEIAFTALLGFVGFSGLVLYVLGATSAMPALLAIHLGAVLTFFLLTPYTKMAHGFYRLAALIRDAQRKRLSK